MAPKLHLYGLQGACSMAPHILLQEANLEHNKTIWKKEELFKDGALSYPDSFKALNPKAKVPVLTVDDEAITENPAVFTIISQLAPEKNFLGKTPLETVRVYEWLNYLSGTLHGHAFGMFFAPQRFTDVEDGSLNKHVVARAKKAIDEGFKYVDGKLEGKTFAVGDDFTAVDAYLFVFYQWGALAAQMPMEKDYPNYAKFVAEVGKRPSVLATLKAEGLA